jgi:hypothetical protein
MAHPADTSREEEARIVVESGPYEGSCRLDNPDRNNDGIDSEGREAVTLSFPYVTGS